MRARLWIPIALITAFIGGAAILVQALDSSPTRALRGTGNVARRAEQDSAENGFALVAPDKHASTGVTTPRVASSEGTADNRVATPSTPDRLRLHVRIERRSPSADALPPVQVKLIHAASEVEKLSCTVAATGETDADGSIEFDVPRDAVFNVRASARVNGHELRGATCALVSLDPVRECQVVLNEVDLIEWHGVVVDRATLRPVAGAEVRRDEGDPPTLTDAQGEFSIQFFGNPSDVDDSRSESANGALIFGRSHNTSSKYPIWIGAPGYCSAATFMQGEHADRSNAQLVFLYREASVRGFALDASGQPRTPAEVQFSFESSAEVTAALCSRSATVDERGRFVFPSLPAGVSLRLDAKLRGETSGVQVAGLVLEPGEVREVMMRVRGHVEVTGHVFDVHGKPLAGGKIRANMPESREEAVIRSDGTYYLPFVLAGKGWIEVHPDEGAAEVGDVTRVPLVIPINATEWAFDVRLAYLGSIAGRLLDADDQPVVDGVVLARAVGDDSGDTKVADANGAFRFDGIGSGEYVISAGDVSTQRENVQVVAHAGDMAVELRLARKGLLRGRVIDTSRNPVRGGFVEIDDAVGGRLYVKVNPDGSYTTSLTAGEFRLSASDTVSQSPIARTVIEAGRETIAPDLVLEECLRIRLIAGRAASQASFELWRGSVLCATGSVLGGDDRTFQVLPGKLRIVVTAAGRAQEEHEFEARADTTTIVPVLFAQ